MQVDVNLRDAGAPDFETLWRIDQDCFEAGIAYSKGELSAYMRHPGAFTLIAESRNSAKILGFIVAELSRKGVGHIITIDIVEDARRFGMGSRLLAAAEDRLRMHACTRIRLEAAVDNASALAFYERHGYSNIKTISGYYSNGRDALLLEKVLG